MGSSVLQHKCELEYLSMIDALESSDRPPLWIRLDALRNYQRAWKASKFEAGLTLSDHVTQFVRYWPCTGGHLPVQIESHLKLSRPPSRTRGTQAHTASIDLCSVNMTVESCVVDKSQDILVLCGQPTDPDE